MNAPSNDPDLPLCAQQEHLLLSREFFESRGVNLSPANVPSILHFLGALDLKRVEDALNYLVARHAALRAGFIKSRAASRSERLGELESFAKAGVFRPGLYRQFVANRAILRLTCLDLSARSAQELKTELHRHINIATSQEFRREEPPLLRASLLKTGPDEYFLILVIDHLVSDAWSMRILRSEFIRAYTNRAVDEPPEFSYPEYALYQRRKSEDGGFASALEFWTKQWSEYSGARIGYGDLNFSRSPPEQPSYHFASEEDVLDFALSTSIRQYVRQNRVTPFVFFITIYAALIRRYTGKQPVALWGHFANRQNAQTQNGVGWLANTHLIVSANWENESSQVQMSRTRHAVLAASAHQEIPVALVWRAMGGYPNDPDAKLLLDVSSSEKTLYQSGNLRIGHASHLLPAYGRFSNLGVYVRDDKETFNVTAQFNVDRFHKGGIRQLLKDFREEIGRFLSSSD